MEVGGVGGGHTTMDLPRGAGKSAERPKRQEPEPGGRGPALPCPQQSLGSHLAGWELHWGTESRGERTCQCFLGPVQSCGFEAWGRTHWPWGVSPDQPTELVLGLPRLLLESLGLHCLVEKPYIHKPTFLRAVLRCLSGPGVNLSHLTSKFSQWVVAEDVTE